jgi:trans-aconitate methyltransferase
VIERALRPLMARRSVKELSQLRIIDPACGSGNFLVAALRALGEAGLPAAAAQRCLVGIDVDPVAIECASARLPNAELHLGDGLTASGPADVVLTNPPFLSPLKGHRQRGHGYADASAVFFAHWVEQLRPGGRLGIVLPLSVLSASNAANLRQRVLASGRLDSLTAQTTQVFDASVHTVIAVVSAEGPDPTGLVDQPTWSHLVASQFGIEAPAGPTPTDRLGDIAMATADFRDQYYGLIGAVSDDASGPPLITSGAIGDNGLRWGTRPTRFGGRRYERPRVDLDRVSPALQQWAVRRLVPKVLVATQTARLRAVTDHTGVWLPSVPVITVEPHDPADLDRVQRAITDQRATQWALVHHLGAALSPRAVKLSAKQLMELPLYD